MTISFSEPYDGSGARSELSIPEPSTSHHDQPGPLRHSSAQEASAVLEALEVRVFLAGCRSNNGMGRYCGEEFVILLPGTTLEVAAQLLERLRCRVQDHP